MIAQNFRENQKSRKKDSRSEGASSWNHHSAHVDTSGNIINTTYNTAPKSTILANTSIAARAPGSCASIQQSAGHPTLTTIAKKSKQCTFADINHGIGHQSLVPTNSTAILEIPIGQIQEQQSTPNEDTPTGVRFSTNSITSSLATPYARRLGSRTSHRKHNGSVRNFMDGHTPEDPKELQRASSSSG